MTELRRSAAAAESSDRGERSTTRATAAYAAVSVVQRGLPLLLLPIYTRALTPEEYGELGVLIALWIGLGFVFAFGQELSLFRQLFSVGSPAERQRLLETGANLLILVPLTAAAVLTVPSVLVLDRWLDVEALDLALVLLGSALFVASTVLPFTVLRAEERLGDFIRVNALLTGITTALTLTFVVLLDWGVTGWFCAANTATLATWVWTTRTLPWPRGLSIHRDYLRELLRIGTPLIPHHLSLWGLQLANRLILVGLVTKTGLAIFTLATTLALPVTLLAGGLLYGVFPSYGRAVRDAAQRTALSATVSVQITAVAALGVVVALIAPVFCTLVFPPIYAPAASLLPLIALGYAVGSLSAVPLNAAALLAGKTTLTWVVTLLAAAANVGILYAAVPRYGLDGAAVAVLVGNAALLVGMLVYSRLVAQGVLEYEWARMGKALALLALCYAGAAVMSGNDDVGDLLVRLLWLGIAAVGLARLGLLPNGLRRALAPRGAT